MEFQGASDFSGGVAGDLSLLDSGAGMVLTSPNGTEYKITVANDGTITSTAV